MQQQPIRELELPSRLKFAKKSTTARYDNLFCISLISIDTLGADVSLSKLYCSLLLCSNKVYFPVLFLIIRSFLRLRSIKHQAPLFSCFKKFWGCLSPDVNPHMEAGTYHIYEYTNFTSSDELSIRVSLRT